MPDLQRCGRCKTLAGQPPSQVGRQMMAQKVTVELEDDLTGGPADETVRFAIEGTSYEIDLSATNAAAFHTLLAPYLEHARKAGRHRPARPGGLWPAGSARVISG